MPGPTICTIFIISKPGTSLLLYDVLPYTTANFRPISPAFKVLNFIYNGHVSTPSHVNNYAIGD